MAASLCRELIAQGFTRILSAGGDGTHFEVTNGCVENGKPLNPEVAVAFLPLGSGADFTRSLRMPRDRGALIDTLCNWDARAVDLVQVEYLGLDGNPQVRVFQNIARAGAGGEVVARAESSRKVLGGFITFLLATIHTLLTYRHKPLCIEIDGEAVEQRFLELVVANGRFDGGGMKSAPHALLDDGLVDVYIYGRITLVDALANLHKIYSGRMMERPDVVRYLKAERLVASSDERVLLEADGELLGVLPATFTLLPGALRAVHGPA